MAKAERNVTFRSEGATLTGYLARPQGEGSFPGVVIIHEIYGLNENIKDIADRFAGEGYMALAVDLFSGRNRAACVLRVMGDFLKSPEKSKLVSDLKNALSFLTSQPGVDESRLGAIGFCMGGGYALTWSCADKRLKVIAPYYGTNPRPLESVERACAVVGSYPEKDFTTKPGTALEKALTRYNIPHDIKIYLGAKHSFFNDKGKNYQAEAAQDSWARVMTFFKEHVGARVDKML